MFLPYAMHGSVDAFSLSRSGWMNGLNWRARRSSCNGNICVMPRVNAFDGKRQINASKAFPERQPANPKTRASSCVGCLLVGERQPEIQSAWALFAVGQGRSGGDRFRHSTARQQRRHTSGEAGLHVRAVRRRRVPAVLPSELEGIDRGHFGADRKNASGLGVRDSICFMQSGARSCRTSSTGKRWSCLPARWPICGGS